MNTVDPTIGFDCHMIKHPPTGAYLRVVRTDGPAWAPMMHPTPQQVADLVTEVEWMPDHQGAGRFFEHLKLAGDHLRLFNRDGQYYACWAIDRAGFVAIAHRFGGRIVKVYSSGMRRAA
jgi:hypothetical protein